MNIIYGPRQSGKTTELFQRVIRYLKKDPENTAIIMSPNKRMSLITRDFYCDFHGTSFLDRIEFISAYEYMKYNQGFYASRARLFIDEMELCLLYLFSHSIDTITLQRKKDDIYEKTE